MDAPVGNSNVDISTDALQSLLSSIQPFLPDRPENAPGSDTCADHPAEYANYSDHPAEVSAESVPATPISNPSYQNINPVASYYDRRTDTGISRRKRTSRYAWIRNFNNWAKSVLISETISVLGSGVHVIDIACGQGGDLKKWNCHGIGEYIGVDISPESIRHAAQRYQNLRDQLDYEAFFFVDDGSVPSNDPNTIPKYSVVSIMFALHYFFETREMAEGLFENIRQRLLPRGRVIGIVADASVILQKVRRSLKGVGNNLYNLVPYNGQKWRSSNRRIQGFGNAYRFQAQASHSDVLMEPCDEYLAPRPVVEVLARNIGCHVVKWQNLQDFFYDHWEDSEYRELLTKMGVVKDDISTDEWDFVRLYNVFVLELPAKL